MIRAASLILLSRELRPREAAHQGRLPAEMYDNPQLMNTIILQQSHHIIRMAVVKLVSPPVVTTVNFVNAPLTSRLPDS